MFLQLLVLKYVQNKDVFMRYHKAHLTRRLILDISADSEIEENMVEWLRVRGRKVEEIQVLPEEVVLVESPLKPCGVSCVQTGSGNAG